MTIAVDWDVKPQTKQLFYLKKFSNGICSNTKFDFYIDRYLHLNQAFVP